MSKIWIGNGQLVLPDRVVSGGSVLLEDRIISAVNVPCPADARRVDAEGCYIMAGFVDIHVHGGGDGDFMDGEASAFPVIAKAHCAHGTTALCPTTMTCEDDLLEKTIDLFLAADKEPEDGAELLGLHLEGPYFSAASKGAQPISRQRIPNREDLERILARGKGRILRWDAAPELPNMELFAQVMREHGVLTSLAHSGATAGEAMQAFDWGFSHVTHFYNACTTFHKKKGILYSGIVEATYLRDDVTIELIGDGCHIPRESMLLALRIKGADRIALITDAMRAAGVDCQRSVLGARETGVPVVIKDDVAQLEDLSSYAGSIATMDRCLRTAHVRYGIELPEVSRMLSLTPARLCGVSHRKGSLEPGKDGDVVILDKDFRVRQVYARGRRCAEKQE